MTGRAYPVPARRQDDDPKSGSWSGLVLEVASMLFARGFPAVDDDGDFEALSAALHTFVHGHPDPGAVAGVQLAVLAPGDCGRCDGTGTGRRTALGNGVWRDEPDAPCRYCHGAGVTPAYVVAVPVGGELEVGMTPLALTGSLP